MFKPKDEEPYGPANPKWQKYLQRIFCPCMFGRGCILPNQGYLSEVAASIVDALLGLDIVPNTKLVQLSSPAFHYTRYKKMKTKVVAKASERFPTSVGKRFRQGLPRKTGSMQTFVRGFKDANRELKRIDFDAMPNEARVSFQHKFESLVILDFIIRNTDRGMDNWLLKYTPASGDAVPDFEIAAIDNGLAFPFKHPDDWRAYPYQWVYMPQAKTPFSDHTCDKILPFLCDDDKVEGLIDDIHVLFSTDPDFSRTTFEKQMSVMRGQIINLREALRTKKSPVQLVNMPSAVITIQKTRRRPSKSQSAASAASTSSLLSGRSYRQSMVKRLPFFRNW